ncbi:ArsR/SmtB family transcription factor [Solirubrobacter soli]|uniref:ArsR/SmtB family transcription factor n=1 Tax=Solirubrobacter soli TaxID=363832 RepID=UPI0004841B03|nr:helix-turn-helix transcriptional regulator [Solirubrobacter soli]
MTARPSLLLAHALRDRLLAAYQLGPASPSDLARRTGEPLNLVSYHTRVLLRHGWLELVRTERRRGGTASVYRATAPGVIEDEEWQRLPPQRRRALIRSLVTVASEEARRAAHNGGFDAGDAHISRWPVRLDEAGSAEVAELLLGMVHELTRIQARSTARAGDQRRVEVVLMGFVASQRRSWRA